MSVPTENLIVERGADTSFSYQLRATPQGGWLDLTNTRLRFVAQPLLEVVLPLHPSNPTIRLLRVTEVLAARIGGKPRDYQIVLDSGDVQTVIVKGTITAQGIAR